MFGNFSMSHDLRSFCQTDSRRLVWLIGVTFAVIITFQYVELPYSNVISSLFSTGKIPVPRNSSLATDAPLSNSTISGNTSHENAVNSKDQFPAPERNKTSTGDGFVPINDGNQNGTSEFNETVDNSLSENSGKLNKSSASNDANTLDNSTHSSAPMQSKGNEQGFTQANNSLGGDAVSFIPPSPGMPATNSDMMWPTSTDRNVTAPVSPFAFNTSSTPTFDKSEKQEQLQKLNQTTSGKNSSVSSVPEVKKNPEVKKPDLSASGYLSIAEMNYLLQQSRISHRSERPMWYSEADRELVDARSQIEKAPIDKDGPVLYAPVYRNISMFKRSYALMEKMLKVYVYKEGKRPIMHVPVLSGIYASEGWFMKLLESNKDFVTKDPKKAHLFYLPFSSRLLEEKLYVKDSHSHKNLIEYLENYLNLISAKYPFWNQTSGADHFLVACHDWAPTETRKIMANCIRALCNSDIKEGFVFGKDVSLPETKVSSVKKPLNGLGGNPPSQRPILAFFAGKMHGYLRPVLLSYWGDNKDPDMKIFGKLPRSKGNKNYIRFMKSSKYCICAKGYEVNSPRVVESIFYECVPVIISDNFVPPFFEILNWESFAVFILEKDIPDLKKILLSIPERRYREMQMRVKKVQKHFLWHAQPEKYDVFHMILHSVWLNRVFRT